MYSLHKDMHAEDLNSLVIKLLLTRVLKQSSRLSATPSNNVLLSVVSFGRAHVRKPSSSYGRSSLFVFLRKLRFSPTSA